MKIQGDFFFFSLSIFFIEDGFPPLFLAENLKKDIEKERFINSRIRDQHLIMI